MTKGREQGVDVQHILIGVPFGAVSFLQPFALAEVYSSCQTL